MTFSLLPDCLAARLPGTLQAIEEAVAAAAPSLTRAVLGDGEVIVPLMSDQPGGASKE